MCDYKPVPIKPARTFDNKFVSGKRVWLIQNLIERAKDLEPFALPLQALYLGSDVWNPIESAFGLAGHILRVQNANLDHPIILDAEGFVMDGWHRITKALIEGRSTITAVRFDETPPCDYMESE